ncbi:MAG TPA: cupin domain-containing protein [Kofleriaceae bacterium]|nr:cupin domain-containing protein [Kofleriaceae bacterium]
MSQFRSAFLGRAPCAAPSTGTGDLALFGWEVLDRVLAARPAPDVLVVARGQLLPLPPPRSALETRTLMEAGIGLAMRRTQRCDEGLARLAEELAQDIGGSAHVQLFVTPGRTHGFGWHYDDEDVFILQTVGIKDYYFRANTVAADEPAHSNVFARFDTETSPLCTARLIAGDFLYLPSRWWHMATCERDALSISVGVDRRAPH